MELSDSLPPYITAVPLGFAMRAWVRSPRPGTGPPGSRTQCFRACQGSLTPPGRSLPRHTGMVRVAFRVFGARRHLDMARFRGSIPCLHVPLSTLRRRRYRGLRMTRGQRGWLALRCLGLAPFNIVPVCPGTPERWRSPAAASGSAADAGGSQVQRFVRLGEADSIERDHSRLVPLTRSCWVPRRHARRPSLVDGERCTISRKR
jgi:hypothetical protein